jgi:hypothetical protein
MANEKDQRETRKPEGTGGKGQGQQKVHRVLNADGTDYVNPATGQPGMTQEEWKARDKSLGLTRPEGEDAAEG